MSNYRKSFNLRNGVQVDDDNFIVNANGLVGIGTSVPTEFLDVRGNAKIVGLTTTNTLYAGIATVGFLTATRGLSVSGIVTANSFSGSASGLTGIYAIAVDGWYVTSGSISTTSNVGIGTTNPQGNLQIGSGVIIKSNGNATYSGILTASSFSGSGIGLTALDSTQLTGTINNARLASNINVSGIITATSGFVGNVTGNITGNVTGIVTGNVTGTASTAQSLTGTPNISVGVVTASSIGVGFATIGIASITELDVGIGGTAFTALISGRIGVGTALPTSEFQIRKSGSTLLEVLSDTSEARISIGQSVGVGKSTALLRFGNTAKTFDIINYDTGNINTILHAGPIGVNTGRFDWLYGQNIAIPLMCLTYGGKLGIGLTNPSNTLHIVGTSTVTTNSYVGQNLTVYGTITAGTFNLPSIVTTNINSNSGISSFWDVNIQHNIGFNSTSPAATIDCKSGTGLFAGIGINTNNPLASFQVADGLAIFAKVGIGTTALVTSQTQSTGNFQSFEDIFVYDSIISVDNTTNCAIGFGTYTPQAAIDFSNVGSTTGTIGTIRGYMLPPFVSSATRSGMGATVPGAIIYNTSTKKHQGYGSTNNGSTYGWQDLY
jgi:hypothetical protein